MLAENMSMTNVVTGNVIDDLISRINRTLDYTTTSTKKPSNYLE